MDHRLTYNVSLRNTRRRNNAFGLDRAIQNAAEIAHREIERREDEALLASIEKAATEVAADPVKPESPGDGNDYY